MLALMSGFTKTIGGMMLSEPVKDYITLKLLVSRELNSPLRHIHASSSRRKQWKFKCVKSILNHQKTLVHKKSQ